MVDSCCGVEVALHIMIRGGSFVLLYDVTVCPARPVCHAEILYCRCLSCGPTLRKKAVFLLGDKKKNYVVQQRLSWGPTFSPVVALQGVLMLSTVFR